MENLINTRHQWVKLCELIDWGGFDREWEESF